ncbi:hypothetical protein N9413_13180, partial [Paracoccaceae bacterium]|nr:hypothetical protein [Paracoccaceae bacterium]
PAVLPVCSRNPRLAFRGPRAGGKAPVQATPGFAGKRRFLARGASAGSCAAALVGIFRAETRLDGPVKIAICHIEISP